VLRAATALLAVGFLAVLVLAWYHGEKGAQRVSGVELLMLTGILVIAGAAVAFVGGGGRDAVTPTTSSDATAAAHARTAIAVLPFENLSAEGLHSYFAGGLHDELLTQLAKVGALSVRGRTSVLGYAGTTKPIGVIADELAVGTIVEGSVQVLGERLRVNVQLIDAATDEHLWAERYDRTLDDAFAVQSDIAQQIVVAVGAALGGAERTAIAQAPHRQRRGLPSVPAGARVPGSARQPAPQPGDRAGFLRAGAGPRLGFCSRARGAVRRSWPDFMAPLRSVP